MCADQWEDASWQEWNADQLCLLFPERPRHENVRAQDGCSPLAAALSLHERYGRNFVCSACSVCKEVGDVGVGIY